VFKKASQKKVSKITKKKTLPFLLKTKKNKNLKKVSNILEVTNFRQKTPSLCKKIRTSEDVE